MIGRSALSAYIDTKNFAHGLMPVLFGTWYRRFGLPRRYPVRRLLNNLDCEKRHEFFEGFATRRSNRSTI